MRGKVLPLLIVSLIAVSAVPYDISEAYEPPDGLILDMVCPFSPEGFTLANNTYGRLDVRDYHVTDGEGTVTFTESIILSPGETLTVMESPPEDWMCISGYRLYGQDGIVADRFRLADSGDDIYVMKGDTIVDSFAWGSVYTDGWEGQGLSRIPKKTVATRNHAYGYGGETVPWRTYVPGMTLYHFTRTYEGCSVIPFSFPESDGKEILKALQDADDTVDISIYTITHPAVFSVLAHAISEGVRVRILVEGSPAGGIPADEISLLTAVMRLGADVHVIRTEESYKRYTYVHSKYAIVDGDTVIITSENWTESSFGSNRGWGCVIESRECAEYLGNFFESDFDASHPDIHTVRELYPTAVASEIDPYVPIVSESLSYTADVTPVVSPDYSRKTLLSFISGADERLYSQQLYVEYGWLQEDGSPLSLMEDLAQSGVDCRLLVDVTYDDPEDGDIEDGYGIFSYYDENGLLDVRYEDSSEFGMAHNKGIVRDDSVWIGSMNWTENSVSYNREMSVIIDSPEIADMYAGLFLRDWDGKPAEEVELSVEVSGNVYGESATLDASGSSVPSGSSFQWDLDGDGECERRGKKVTWRFYEDTECVLMVITPDGETHEHTFTVTVDGGEGSDEEETGEVTVFGGPVKYLPLAALGAIIIGVKRNRRSQ